MVRISQVPPMADTQGLKPWEHEVQVSPVYRSHHLLWETTSLWPEVHTGRKKGKKERKTEKKTYRVMKPSFPRHCPFSLAPPYWNAALAPVQRRRCLRKYILHAGLQFSSPRQSFIWRLCRAVAIISNRHCHIAFGCSRTRSWCNTALPRLTNGAICFGT